MNNNSHVFQLNLSTFKPLIRRLSARSSTTKSMLQDVLGDRGGASVFRSTSMMGSVLRRLTLTQNLSHDNAGKCAYGLFSHSLVTALR